MAGLLTETQLSCIGRTEPPITETVSRRDIRKYALASQQRLAKYLNGDEAPPLFHTQFFAKLIPIDELEPDGHLPEPLCPPMPLHRMMAGGRDIEYFQPIRPGDVLTAVRSLVDIQERQGRSGPLIIVTLQIRVTNEKGEPVLVERYTRILH